MLNCVKYGKADVRGMKSKEERAKIRAERLKERIAPYLIRMRLLALLEAGLIDVSRLHEARYLAQQLVDDSLYDQAPSRMFTETENVFLRGARLLGKRSDKQSAVILLFTAVEHITNFYIRIFAELRKHDAATIAEMISTAHPLKISVILPSLGVEISARLKAKISELRAIRNRIIHFDHLPYIIHPRNEKEGSYDKLRKALRGIILQRFYHLPDSLRQHCESVYQKNHPNYRDMLRAARVLGCV
jgi:hypothetical protein